MCNGTVSIFSKNEFNARGQLEELKKILLAFDAQIEFGDFVKISDDIYKQHIISTKNVKDMTGFLNNTKLFQVYNLRQL